MIIKRKKNNPPEDNNNKKKSERKEEQKPIETSPTPDPNIVADAFASIAERQERRRGDRRRGYRRVDDRNLISRAQEEANTIKETSAKEGFQHGLTQANDQISSLNEAIEAFFNAKEEAMQKASSDIVFIATKVAEKIIKTEIACDDTIVLNIIKEVLNEVGKKEKNITIKVNSFDTEVVKNNLPVLLNNNDDIQIRVVEDDSIDQGSCIVETNNGLIDARFTTQLEVINKAFKENI